MKSLVKLLLIAGVAPLSVSHMATASITASMDLVCSKVNAQQADVKSKSTDARQGNSSLLAQHFNVTTCSGKQMLENTRLERVESLSLKVQNNSLVNTQN